MKARSLFLFCLMTLLLAPLAFAQTTGSVTGVAKDSNGAPLPGVLVSITGPQMPLGRSMATRSDGVFQFLNLVPGRYQLKAELQGLGSFQQEVVVGVAKDTEVYPVLSAKASESVTVTAAVPLVDTKATDLSTVTPRSTMEKLPLVRTFSGTFQLAPGVADSGVAISNTNVGVNAGGGRQDNTYLYDGVNVTNPFFGDLYQDFAELDIQEVNITRSGATPELGRTGGFIVNGVTKSGTNTLHGDVRLEYQPSAFQADSDDPNLQTHTNRFRPGVGVGGPLIHDHLFAYGSLNFYRASQTDRVNDFGSIPDSDLNINEYFLKLSGQPNSNQLIDASFRYRGIDQTYADIGSSDAASTGDNPKEIDRVGVFSWFWTVNPALNLEFKYNYDDYPAGASPVTPLPYQPPFNAADPASVGNYCVNDVCTGSASLFSNDDNFQRQEFKFGTTYLAQAWGASHQIKVGATYSANREDLKRVANGWGAITRSTSSNCGTDANGDALTCYRARFSPLQPAQVSKAHTIGVYLQDQATWNRLTLNLGVLVNQDTFIPNGDGQFVFVQGDYTLPNSQLLPCTDPNANPNGCTYQDTLTIPFSKQWQPRVGIAYETNANIHDKAFVNYARYDNMDNQSIARSASPFRLYRTDAYFNLVTGEKVFETTRSNQQSKRVLGNIDPTFTDEFTLGYARPLGNGWSAEISGTFRYTKDVIEDFPATGVQDNPGNFRYGNIPAWRKYRAMTIQVQKAYGANWTMDVSYTLSRLVGNWDLDYATQLFYSSSYIEDGPGIYVTDPNRTGTLTGNRTHVAKVFGSYQFSFPLNLGGYLRVQTGAPWQAQEYDPTYGVPYQYLEKAGSRTLPTWTNFDMSASWTFPIASTSLRIEGRLLNVFNTQPVLNVNTTLYADDSNTTLNPNFGQPFGDSSFAAYAPPRTFVLSAIFNF
jgi:hypothetical protein